jgi:hypothetical protein
VLSSLRCAEKEVSLLIINNDIYDVTLRTRKCVDRYLSYRVLHAIARGYTKETGNRNAKPFRQFALLHLVTWFQISLITFLGNCGWVAVASFLGVPSGVGRRY